MNDVPEEPEATRPVLSAAQNTVYPFIERVLTFWEAHDVPYLPGASKAKIRSFEKSNGVSLPDDMQAFYLTTNGVRVPGSPEVDHDNYDFYPLDGLTRAERHPSMFYFANYLQYMWSFTVAVEGPHRGGVFVAPGGDEFIKVASTFGEFMELYVVDDQSLYPKSWGKK